MRLSEAILLGSANSKLMSGQLHGKDGEACALGMAENAIGQRTKAYDYSWEDTAVAHNWPWLLHRYSKYPCLCPSRPCCAFDVITHLFDVHVFSWADWTLEQLCDYVRSVEPEEAPEQAEVFAEAEKIAAGDTRRQG